MGTVKGTSIGTLATMVEKNIKRDLNINLGGRPLIEPIEKNDQSIEWKPLIDKYYGI